MWRGNLDQTMLYCVTGGVKKTFHTLNFFYFRLEPYLESVLAFSGGTPLHLVFIRFCKSHYFIMCFASTIHHKVW